MDWTQIIGSVAVLLVAFVAYIRATSALEAAETAKLEATRRASSVETDLRQEVETLRRLVTKLAAGEPVSAEMIEDGQLFQDIDAAAAEALVKAHANTVILDVRTTDETAAGIIDGAKLIPMDDIADRKSELPSSGAPILVYCAAGSRSAAVCDYLSKEGFDRLHNLTGGFGSWNGQTSKPNA